jgi:hypothetical protein
MTVLPAPDIELILDVRDLRTPPGTREEFAALWNLLEPALNGRDLGARRVHKLEGADGTLRLEVARIAAGAGLVTSGTRFAVVAVREPSKVHYQCKECAGDGRQAYGPFVCSDSSGGQEHRACDRHVSILDGSLTPTCGAHRPGCRACAAPAAFWCAGKSCRRKVAWCQQHRKQHPQDPDVAYCPSCYAAQFPPCEAPGCRAIGTVTCEHVSRAMEPCARRMCTRHARRWQVFGGERLGLGRCTAHARVTGLPPEDLMFQVIVGASTRRRPERLPSLAGFGHTLRLAGHLQLSVDYPTIFKMLKTIGGSAGRGSAGTAGSPAERVRAACESAEPGWVTAAAKVAGHNEEGERLVARLRQIVRELLPRDGAAIAAAITLAEYKPPRPGSQPPVPGRLFVNVPESYGGLFTGAGGSRRQEYERRLGVEVKIHGGRGRR